MSGSPLRRTISSPLAFYRYVQQFMSFDHTVERPDTTNIPMLLTSLLSHFTIVKLYFWNKTLCYTRIILTVHCSVGRKQSETAVAPIFKGGLILPFYLQTIIDSRLRWLYLVLWKLTADVQSLNVKILHFPFAHLISCSIIVFDQIHERAATGREARIKENLRWNHPGPAGCD